MVSKLCKEENFSFHHTDLCKPLGEQIGQCQVKLIEVNPGAALSLQSHNHRSEHWIIVEGTAKVMINDDIKTATENPSVYIPSAQCTVRKTLGIAPHNC